MGFANADHRGVYLDLDSRPGLDTIVEELATRKARKLVSKNSKNVNTYVKEVLTRFKEQNIYDRVTNLWKQTKGGNINTEQKAQYNTLEGIITKIIVKEESLLPSKRRNGWSLRLSKIVHKIRYLRTLRKSIIGRSITQKTLERQWHRAGTNFYSCDKEEVEAELKKTWGEFRTIQQEAEKHRRQHMMELLSYHQLMDNNATAKSIQDMERADKQKRMQTRINRVEGKKKRGVRMVHAPTANTETGENE